MKITDEMVDAAIKAGAAQARVRHPEIARFPDDYDEDEIAASRLEMRAALEAVLPMIRNATLEEAASVADNACVEPSNTRDVDALMQELAANDRAEFIAWTIRAMKGTGHE